MWRRSVPWLTPQCDVAHKSQHETARIEPFRPRFSLQGLKAGATPRSRRCLTGEGDDHDPICAVRRHECRVSRHRPHGGRWRLASKRSGIRGAVTRCRRISEDGHRLQAARGGHQLTLAAPEPLFSRALPAHQGVDVATLTSLDLASANALTAGVRFGVRSNCSS